MSASLPVPTDLPEVGPSTSMADVLKAYPGAQRALFRKYHIGGCASCGFRPDETVEDLCRRNDGLNVGEVLEFLKESREQDAQILIEPEELARRRQEDPDAALLDVRSRQEFDAARIEGSLHLTQPLMQEIMAQWPRERLIVVVDHEGKQSMDAAAFFIGHGFTQVRSLRGGIDAWSERVDPSLPRYQLV